MVKGPVTIPAGVEVLPSREEIAAALEREGLVGTTAAARILDIKAPNFKRDAAPHLIEIKVEGSASSYFRSEVEELAVKFRERRSAEPAAAS